MVIIHGGNRSGSRVWLDGITVWQRFPVCLPCEGHNLLAFEDALAWGGVPHITLKINFVSLAHCLLLCYFVTVLWIIGLKPCLKAGAVKP